MECRKLENYYKVNDCSAAAIVPVAMQKHLAECVDCRLYSRFVAALNLQNNRLETAPSDLLPAIEKRISGICGSKNKEPFFRLHPLWKPAFAGFALLCIAAVAFTFLTNNNAGYVENLSDRFKLARFENIKSGEMLYVGDNTTTAIRLKSNNNLQIHQNSIVKVTGSRQITLSRGEISLLTGDKELRIETPDGMLSAKNAMATIQTITRLEKGTVTTETTCRVFTGKLVIRNSLKETVVGTGQKVVLAENGRTIDQKQLTGDEMKSAKGTMVEQKVLTAVQALCDVCIYNDNYAPGKKPDHQQLFGKEVNENRFNVHIFWREKGLRELVSAPSYDNNNLCSIKMRRIRA